MKLCVCARASNSIGHNERISLWPLGQSFFGTPKMSWCLLLVVLVCWLELAMSFDERWTASRAFVIHVMQINSTSLDESDSNSKDENVFRFRGGRSFASSATADATCMAHSANPPFSLRIGWWRARARTEHVVSWLWAWFASPCGQCHDSYG